MMRILGKPIYTADNSSSSPAIYQKFTMPDNKLVRSIRIGIIQYNNPTYTSVSLNVYANRSNAPGKLLYSSSTSVTKATIGESINHAYKDIYFDFTDFTLRDSDSYYAALFINGAYVGNSTTHLAWKTAWPDPMFKTGVTITQAQAATFPLEFYMISTDI